MSTPTPTSRPGMPWRLASVAVMSSVGAASRAFLYAFNKVEVTGLDNLLGVLDRRRTGHRDRGLLTVCNHVSVYGVSINCGGARHSANWPGSTIR